MSAPVPSASQTAPAPDAVHGIQKKQKMEHLATLSLNREGGFQELEAGHLCVRLAENEAERDAARALRYRVFFEEMGAHPSPEAFASKRDRDEFDEAADYLLVIDRSIENGPKGVVGTYRLLRSDAAKKVGRFYTSDEYDISRLEALGTNLLEVGRSCIAPDYRRAAAMQLLWRGISAYIFLHRIDILFGCASLSGADPAMHRDALGWLYHHHLAPPDLRLKALPGRYVDMAVANPETLDSRACLAALPPLIKGYLRLGGYIGDGAVVDRDFNTTDVAILVKSDLMTDKYYRHYERRLRDALG